MKAVGQPSPAGREWAGHAFTWSNGASKGKNGGRVVPLNKELRTALIALKAKRNIEAGDRIIHSERDLGMAAGAVQVWFHRLYNDLGFEGASSHSGRRTFVTRCAKNIVAAELPPIMSITQPVLPSSTSVSRPELLRRRPPRCRRPPWQGRLPRVGLRCHGRTHNRKKTSSQWRSRWKRAMPPEHCLRK